MLIRHYGNFWICSKVLLDYILVKCVSTILSIPMYDYIRNTYIRNTALNIMQSNTTTNYRVKNDHGLKSTHLTCFCIASLVLKSFILITVFDFLTPIQPCLCHSGTSSDL